VKYLFLCLCYCKSYNKAFAQINPANIYGTWVKSKVTFKDGALLSDDSPLKYAYIKYTFSSPNKVNPSSIYFQQGPDNAFEIVNNYLVIKTPQGGLMNMLYIESVKDTLILVQKGPNGFEDPESLKYYFIREPVYQSSIPLTPSLIRSIISGDTIYKENPKIYASYKRASFQSFVYQKISDNISMDNRGGQLVASFIVSKDGIADSLKILEGIDDIFNKRFAKIFTSERKSWKPAVLNGKYVAVEMMIELRYSGSEVALRASDFSRDGSREYYNKNYAQAIYYFDKALENVPFDKDNLYKRGMCKMRLGNINGACEDWNKIKALGGVNNVDALLEKYCK
jgi:tetratricopeptide (TPR) repeat protein